MRYNIRWTSLRTLGQVTLDTVKYIQKKQLPLIASSLSFTTILAIVPALAVSLAFFKALGGLDAFSKSAEPKLLTYFTGEIGQEIFNSIYELVSQIDAGALGTGGMIGLVITTILMLSTFEKVMNMVWDTSTSRTLYQRLSNYWLFITLGPLGLTFILGAVNSKEFGKFNVLPTGFLGIFLSVLVFFLVYKLAPSRKVNFRPALISAVFTTVLSLVASKGFGFYIKNIVSYSKIYGSLGILPTFFLLIYVVWLVVLTGAALGATLQNRYDLK